MALAAAFSVPPGLGVVEGDEIPYLPAALEKRNTNRADWVKLDPEVKCFMPGIPRATYMPYPFQIVQSKDNVIFTYEFSSASRIVRMNSEEKSPAPAWMGWSLGKWDGESLVRGDRSLPDTGSIAPGTSQRGAEGTTRTAIDANRCKRGKMERSAVFPDRGKSRCRSRSREPTCAARIQWCLSGKLLPGPDKKALTQSAIEDDRVKVDG